MDSAACTSYDTVEVVVNTLPFVNAGLDSSFCAGDSLQLSATAYGTGNGGAEQQQCQHKQVLSLAVFEDIILLLQLTLQLPRFLCLQMLVLVIWSL